MILLRCRSWFDHVAFCAFNQTVMANYTIHLEASFFLEFMLLSLPTCDAALDPLGTLDCHLIL